MNKSFIIQIFVVFTIFAQDSVHVHLPDSVYTTTENELSIYYTNLIRGRFEKNEQIIVSCEVGYPDSMKYNLDSLQAGVYDFNIQIYDSLGLFIEEADTKIVSTDKSICKNDTLKMLLIGDCFTYAGIYAKSIKDTYFHQTGRPIKLLGTSYNASRPFYGIDNDIYHEGYEGKNWFWFVAYEESPFVFEGILDFRRYFFETLCGEKPDIILIFLGLTDIGNADPTSIETIDDHIDYFTGSTRMGRFLDSLNQALPESDIGVVLTPPGNEREYTYSDDPDYDYWQRKLMHHRLAQRYDYHFKSLKNPRISVIPLNVSTDTYNWYGELYSNHLTFFGYEEVGENLLGWIKYRISKWLTVPKGIELVNGDNYNTLTWNPSTGATSYRIYRSADPYSGFVEIGTSVTPDFTDSDISGSDKYFYRITAEKGVK